MSTSWLFLGFAVLVYVAIFLVMWAWHLERRAFRSLLDEQQADHWRRTEHYRRKLAIALGADDLFDDTGEWREKTR